MLNENRSLRKPKKQNVHFEQSTSDTSYWDSLTVTNMKWDTLNYCLQTFGILFVQMFSQMHAKFCANI